MEFPTQITDDLPQVLRKVRHVWEGGFPLSGMYLATVACDTPISNLQHFPMNGGDSQRGLRDYLPNQIPELPEIHDGRLRNADSCHLQ